MAMNAQANTQGQGEGCGLQEKELRHVLSNLNSLKQLYGLIYVKENDPKKIGSENLDDKARILLKNLLDCATEQALQSHFKIISGQLGASIASKDLVRHGNQQTLENNVQIQDPGMSSHAITSDEDDQSQIKQTSPAIIGGDTGKLEFTATQSLNTWSCDRICRKCYRQRPDLAKVKKNSCYKQRLKGAHKIRVGSKTDCCIVVDEGDNEAEKLIDVSKELARAIQRIEAEINVDQTENPVGSANDTVRVGSMIRKDVATQTTEVESKTHKKKGPLPSQTGNAVGTSRRVSQSLPRQKISQASRKIREPALPDRLPSHASKAIPDTNELPSRMLSRINKGRMASPDPSNGGKSIQVKNELPSRLMSQNGKKPIQEMLDSSNQKARKPKEAYNDSSGRSKPSKSLLVVGPTLMRNESLNPHPRNGKSMIRTRNLSHQITKRPSFRDPTAVSTRSRDPSYQAWGGTRKESTLKSTPLPHQRKAKVIIAPEDSDSCSTWTSQDTYSDETEDPPIYHETESTSSQNSYTSEESLTYQPGGSTSRQMVDPTSKSRMYIPHDHISPPGHKGNPKAIGRWRKLKDKLIIFHHHHHHHHNHDEDYDNGDEIQVRRAAPNHVCNQSVKKHLRQILHRPSKEDNRKLMAEIYGERVAVRTPRQHKQGYFHALMSRLLRHVWQSKKSKASLRGIKRLGKVPKYGKVAKKRHWWRKFRKRGVKLANSVKPRVNLGFKTKRPYLRAG
ncbi:uncharacterized protein LOC122076369 [Macadamia integrifolia]|uniref:uncharacterized protein LOC122076369 n=1 Tax=Macadamia integrifolia TaxID=60698 RepID=UPI001C4F89BD|nr:uncharacterized protein LOC122076369 [Macadamia integrifolia]